MLLPSQKPSSSYSLLKFAYVIDQLRRSLVVHPLLRKILDPPLFWVLLHPEMTVFPTLFILQLMKISPFHVPEA